MGLKHPALMKDSGWRFSSRLRELNAAQAWGCPSPGFFDDLSKNERIDIVAWYESNWKINAVNNYEAQKQAERDAKRK